MHQNKFGHTKLRQAVILAGGKGERLKPLTDEIPKPLASVNGVPFLDYLIESLIQVGIDKILLLLGYKSDMIKTRYGSKANGQLTVEYSVGTVEDQTGTRLKNASALLDDEFMLLYGDNYWPIELDDMLAIYDAKKSQVLMTVFDNAHNTGEYGPGNNVSVDKNNSVVAYDRDRSRLDLNGVNIGYFIVNKSVLEIEAVGNFSFEDEMLPKSIADGQVCAHVTGRQYHYITDIGSLEAFAEISAQQKITSLNWTNH